MTAVGYFGVNERNLVRRGESGAVHLATPHATSSRWFAMCGRYLGGVVHAVCLRSEAPEFAETHPDMLCPDCRALAEHVGSIR